MALVLFGYLPRDGQTHPQTVVLGGVERRGGLIADGVEELRRELQAKTAELASNLPKGQVAMEGRIQLTTPAERLTLGEALRIGLEVAEGLQTSPARMRMAGVEAADKERCSFQPRNQPLI